MKNTWPLITHRTALGFFLNRYGLLGDAVEVGACRGQFAREVLSQWEGKSWTMIDPHEAQDKEIYRETTEGNDWNEWKQHCLQLCEEDPRAKLITAYSPAAADQFKMASLDCCYIDGNHSYRAVMEDCDAWWPKVKMGGILGGHDHMTNTEGGAWIEVDKAVQRWAREHGVAFYVTPCTSWWIHKTTP